MNDDKHYHDSVFSGDPRWVQEPIIVAAVVPEGPIAPTAPPRVMRRRIWLPVGLFAGTCISTFLAGSHVYDVLFSVGLATGAAIQLVGGVVLDYWQTGLVYGLSVMTILVCHEAGHFLQTRRYGVYASLPFFLPWPVPPIGTLGAVILMDSRAGDRKALFDIGISGPLAGLVPTLIFCVLGIWSAEPRFLPPHGSHGWQFGEPLLFKFLEWLKFGSLADGYTIQIGPMGFAGWVGLLITSLNLLPIGQLDGGHILYGLLRRRAHAVATFLLLAAIVAVVATGCYEWTLMLFLLVLMGPKHPPTANDNVPLGAWRTVLGWLTLAFIFVGFTPRPIIF